MEILVVVAITLVVAGLSIPSLSRSIDNARLKASAQTLAGFYQQARIRATQDNTYYELVSRTSRSRAVQLCLDLNSNGRCDTNEPTANFPTQVKLSNAGVPALPEVGFSPLQTESSTMYNQKNHMVPGLAWNARGLPCQRTSPTSSCSNSIPGAVGWVQYIKFQRSAGDVAYAAVTVSPTGRIKTWTYDPAIGSWH
jgi:Tfp pilus assembly protein FimT